MTLVTCFHPLLHFIRHMHNEKLLIHEGSFWLLLMSG